MFPSPEAQATLDNLPKLPPLSAHLWELFNNLHRRRNWTVDGPQRFAWEAIQAFQNVTHSHITSRDLDAIFAVEDVFFEVYAEQAK
jgi:hypothetical protein